MNNCVASSYKGSDTVICEECNHNLAKYRCPRCAVRSCSVSCIKAHKNKYGCSGVRAKTSLIDKEKMDNLTLLSDYRFLEEIDHKLDDGLRNPLRRYIVFKGREEEKNDLPPHLYHLKMEAKKRSTYIDFMPQHFSRHQENTTRFHFADKKIRWHLKLIFHQADLSFVEKSVDEDTPLVSLLTKYLEPTSNSLSPEELEKLAYYQSASYRRVVLLLKSDIPHKRSKFYEMFMSKSLRLNLANCNILEYPTFYVVLRDHIDTYLDFKDTEEQNFFKTDENGLEFQNGIVHDRLLAFRDNTPHELGKRGDISIKSLPSCNTFARKRTAVTFNQDISSIKRKVKKDKGVNFFNSYSSDDDTSGAEN